MSEIKTVAGYLNGKYLYNFYEHDPIVVCLSEKKFEKVGTVVKMADEDFAELLNDLYEMERTAEAEEIDNVIECQHIIEEVVDAIEPMNDVEYKEYYV